MYEFHGWVGLSESVRHYSDGGLMGAIEEVGPFLGRLQGDSAIAEVRGLNGVFYLVFHGNRNHRDGLDLDIDALLNFVAERLPGSWGLVYDRDDQDHDSPFANMFRVKVLARGVVAIREDPFLSPVIPTIKDA